MSGLKVYEVDCNVYCATSTFTFTIYSNSNPFGLLCHFLNYSFNTKLVKSYSCMHMTELYLSSVWL